METSDVWTKNSYGYYHGWYFNTIFPLNNYHETIYKYFHVIICGYIMNKKLRFIQLRNTSWRKINSKYRLIVNLLLSILIILFIHYLYKVQ